MPLTRLRDSRSTTTTQTRSERMFSEQNLWYFKVREGDEVGPFRYRCEAESNLNHFMHQLKQKLNQGSSTRA
ncbi:MAG: hypothetical protein IIB72_03610 [Proteobacteria bacterium]|nr:hypothetical protein [Pseudomonadota bacterium]